MNQDLLLNHFDRISEAPDAVPHLRRFILDLAVRGKLVEQDSSDGPASELLRNIQAEKARLVKERKIRKQIVQPDIDPASFPFLLPKGWVWARLGDVIQLLSGQHLQPGEYSDQKDGGLPYITGPADFAKNGLVITRHALVKKAIAKKGQILLTVKGAGVGKTAICNLPEVAISRQLMAMTAIAWSQQFLLLTTHRLAAALIESARSLIPGISREDVDQFIFGLPPLAEQDRIVAKVDELMALCDRLEATQRDRETRRDRLTAASHYHLNNGADTEAARKHARFYVNHLPTISNRPEQIPALREAIINLAVRGRLVPQDPDDDPTSELLKRIQSEIAESVRAGDTKEFSKNHVNVSNDAPFDIPQSWQWVTLDQIAFGFRYGTSVKCYYERTGEPVLRIPNVVNGEISVEDLKFGPLAKREADELRLRLGDILMVRSNGSLDLVGRPALVGANAVGYCYAGYLIRVRISSTNLDARYILLALSSTHVREQIELPIRTTVGLKNVNATELSGLTIPLPPLAEQHRIVAKVDELMAICDQLKEQLGAVQDESYRLLEAVLHSTLMTAGEPTGKKDGLASKSPIVPVAALVR
jgi:type I restriction enzyme S subunit